MCIKAWLIYGGDGFRSISTLIGGNPASVDSDCRSICRVLMTESITMVSIHEKGNLALFGKWKRGGYLKI